MPRRRPRRQRAPPAGQGADLGQRLAWGAAYMQKHHQGAQMWEIWPSDDKGGGDLRVYWFDANRQYADAELDTATGEEMGPATAMATVPRAPPWAATISWTSTMNCMQGRWDCG